MEKPTCEQLLNEDGVKSVQRNSDDGWRHGCDITEVFHRDSDDTYWMASYRVSNDGETHELREGIADINQVKPQEKTVIEYVDSTTE